MGTSTCPNPYPSVLSGLPKKRPDSTTYQQDPKTDPVRLARLIFEKAVKVEYKSVDDLATVWTEYAEFEVRQENHPAAHKVLKRATVVNFTGTDLLPLALTLQLEHGPAPETLLCTI